MVHSMDKLKAQDIKFLPLDDAFRTGHVCAWCKLEIEFGRGHN